MSRVVIKNNPDFQRGLVDEPTLFVAEMFGDTIQGEGVNTGVPATFIRLQGCTLSCSWCFHPNIKIRSVKRGLVPIKDILVGEEIYTLDIDKGLVVTKVLETMKTPSKIVDDILIIYVEGCPDHPITVTKNHEFYTSRGWVTAQELEIDDEVYSLHGRDFMSSRMKLYNPSFNSTSIEKSKHTFSTNRERGITKSYIRTEEHKKIQRTKKIGELNPMKNHEVRLKNALSHGFKQTPSSLEERYIKIFSQLGLDIKYIGNNKLAIGDKDSGYKFPDFIVEGEKKVIEVYDTTYPFYVEGMRGEAYELEKRSHYEKFGYRTLFLTERDFDKFSIIISFVCNGIKVVKIEEPGRVHINKFTRLFGERDIDYFDMYNLKCSPYNTYTITHKNLLVHNCDSESVWRYGNPYTINELCNLLESSGLVDKMKGGQHLVLTGGSPLKQQLELIQFIELFISRFGFKPYIEIENEAVLSVLDDFASYVDCWNNSPKLESSGNTKRAQYKPKVLQQLSAFKNSWFKFVITEEEDWVEIKRDFIQPSLILREQVILMPEGATRDELNRTRELTVNIAVRENVRFSEREHIIIWNRKTGV